MTPETEARERLVKQASRIFRWVYQHGAEWGGLKPDVTEPAAVYAKAEADLRALFSKPQGEGPEGWREVVNAARELIASGLRNNGEYLIVVEKADKSDPHWRLCDALERYDAAPKPQSEAGVGEGISDLLADLRETRDKTAPGSLRRGFEAHITSVEALAQSERRLREADAAAALVMTNVAQIIDVVRGEWSAENAWSEWDQSVRDSISSWLADHHARAALSEKS